MKATAPRQATREAGRKKPKLKLNKETLKDLSAPDKDIKGGARVETNPCKCNIDGLATVSACTS